MKSRFIRLWFCAVTVCLLALFSGNEACAQIRTWTDIRGNARRAEFVSRHGDTITLRCEDGKTMQGHMNQLSKEDQAYVYELNGQSVKKGEDASGEKAAHGIMRKIFGPDLVNSNGKVISSDDLEGKMIGILFSAHWCPPCRTFTPELIKAYRTWGKALEVVLVSSDRSAGDMFEYMKKMRMPWPALPHGSEQVSELRKRYNVKGIPKLVIIDSEGNTITEDGRSDVMKGGRKALSNWQASAKDAAGKGSD